MTVCCGAFVGCDAGVASFVAFSLLGVRATEVLWEYTEQLGREKVVPRFFHLLISLTLEKGVTSRNINRYYELHLLCPILLTMHTFWGRRPHRSPPRASCTRLLTCRRS